MSSPVDAPHARLDGLAMVLTPRPYELLAGRARPTLVQSPESLAAAPSG